MPKDQRRPYTTLQMTTEYLINFTNQYSNNTTLYRNARANSI